MFSGITMLVLGVALSIFSVFKFKLRKTDQGILLMILAAISIIGGIILLALSNAI